MSSKQSTHSDESLTVPARFDQLRRITEFVSSQAERAGFTQLELHRIELAVDEACSNIIQHAYAGQPGGLIRARVWFQPRQRIVITLIDTGQPFDPEDVPKHDPEAELDDMKVGGLGLFLMRQAMDEVRFEFDVRGQGPDEPVLFNRLTMIKVV
jgi:anti-sigma regulatory factor (Ser/Thr protein kinase)